MLHEFLIKKQFYSILNFMKIYSKITLHLPFFDFVWIPFFEAVTTFAASESMKIIPDFREVTNAWWS